MISKPKHIAIILALFLLSVLLIEALIPEYHPFGGVNLSNNQMFIKQKVFEVLDNSNIKYDKNELQFEFDSERPLLRYVNSEFPLDEANQILKSSEGAYFWNVYQSSKDDSNIIISNNAGNDRINQKRSFELKCTDKGNIISLNRKLSENSIPDTSLTFDEIKKMCTNFIQNINPRIILVDDTLRNSLSNSDYDFFFKDVEVFRKGNRTDYKIEYETNSTPLKYLLIVHTRGDQIEGFNIEAVIPGEYKIFSEDLFEIITEIAFVLLIIVMVIVIGFKRFRAFEIGFKQAMVFGIIIFVSFIAKEILERFSGSDFTFLIGITFGGIIIAGAAIILWAVSETIFREVWNIKFLSLDLIRHGKFNHSKVGFSIINGIAFGFGITALFFISLRITSEYFNISFLGEYFRSLSHLNALLPSLNIVFGVLNSYGILSVSFFMLLFPMLKKYISSDLILILVGGLIWAVLIHSKINPVTAGLAINFLLGITLSFVLVKFDLLSTLLTYLIFQFLLKATQFSFIQEPSLHSNWIYILIFSLVLIIVGILCFVKKDKFTDYDSITPRFVENITERQRLQKELEVARHVQMSFLPKTNPVIKGLEISSVCIPAFEVGGDYYDFIKIDNNKLGIIIGDVSGKGTQAAFYMTLTKGFIKAIAKHTESPAEVLSKMNELFYENVERGRFISMIYAVVDMQKMSIRIARAGHNPIIKNENSENVNLINPNGLALGLEKGDLFRKVITEHEEKLSSGKNYIFYTDGFTEAVNKKGIEYGLENLMKIARENSDKSASELLDMIIADVKTFIGKAQQHDDMTMLVLKVK